MKINTDLFLINTLSTSFSAQVDDRCLIRRKGSPCPYCGRNESTLMYESDSFVVHNAQKKWPDILGPGIASNIRIVSERVANDIQESSLTGYSLSPMTCEGIFPNSYKLTTHYYKLSASSDSFFTPIMPNHLKNHVCEYCGRWHPDERINTQTSVGLWPISITKWDGSDFVYAHHACKNEFFCSRRVIDLCMQKGWTNFGFSARLEKVFISCGLTNWEKQFEIMLRTYVDSSASIHRYSSIEFEWDNHGIILPEGWDKPKESVPAPESKPRVPLSDHPFDNLTYFDGTSWQGKANLSCAFGDCDLVILEDEKAEFDVDDNADYLPMPGQRKLFDFLVRQQTELQPLLRDVIVTALREVRGLAPLSPVVEFERLSGILHKGLLEIGNASKNGIGIADLSFDIRGTYRHWEESAFGFSTEVRPAECEEMDATLILKIACNPLRKTIKIKSWEIE